jgi:ABC-type Fe3+-siderophore transport system permease subunit
MQVVIAMICFVSGVYFAQFTNNFLAFLMVYGILPGMGFGIVYFLPIKCAWSYFPGYRNLVAGAILCCFSINAIITSVICLNIVNPYNNKPSVTIQIGENTENFYPVDSYEVQQLNKMFTRLAELAAIMMICSLPFLTLKPEPKDAKLTNKGLDLLDLIINQKELEERSGSTPGKDHDMSQSPSIPDFAAYNL